MIEELTHVLDVLKGNIPGMIYPEFKRWSRLTDMTEVLLNTGSERKLVINVITDIREDKSDAKCLHIFNDHIRYYAYKNIDIDGRVDCDDIHESTIKFGIRSEEEFFQESTLDNFGDMLYSEYSIIQEIREVLTGGIL